ncbi:hypothetical protein GCM10027280_29540 [Micromonospora polyrhachis]
MKINAELMSDAVNGRCATYRTDEPDATLRTSLTKRTNLPAAGTGGWPRLGVRQGYPEPHDHSLSANTRAGQLVLVLVIGTGTTGAQVHRPPRYRVHPGLG